MNEIVYPQCGSRLRQLWRAWMLLVILALCLASDWVTAGLVASVSVIVRWRSWYPRWADLRPDYPSDPRAGLVTLGRHRRIVAALATGTTLAALATLLNGAPDALPTRAALLGTAALVKALQTIQARMDQLVYWSEWEALVGRLSSASEAAIASAEAALNDLDVAPSELDALRPPGANRS